LAFGVSAENILLPFLYITLPFLPTLLPVSVLLSLMVSFSKMSEDGELVAMFSFGYSLRRLLVPLSGFLLVLYGAAFYSSIELEAWGRREFVRFLYEKTQTEIDNLIRFKIQPGVFIQDFLGYVFYAEKISPDRTHYRHVFLTPKKGASHTFSAISAPAAEITGSVEKGDLRMRLYDGLAYSPKEGGGTTTLRFQKADLDLLRIFQEQILGDEKKEDYRSFPILELRATVAELSTTPETPLYRRAYYLYLSRLINPFSLIAFALFGLLLGIRDQRQANAMGYLNAVGTIILCTVLQVVFRWYGERGILPIPFAVWTPPLILLMFSSFLVYQKNRLPLSEPVLAWKNFPGRKPKKES